MRLIRAKDYQDMSRKAANIISAQVILKPESVLGLATGSTPIGIYHQLIDWYKKGDVDFSRVVSINLDEYCGLSDSNPQSYSRFMREHFFDTSIFPQLIFSCRTVPRLTAPWNVPGMTGLLWNMVGLICNFWGLGVTLISASMSRMCVFHAGRIR